MTKDNNASPQTGTQTISEQFLLGKLIEAVAVPFQSLSVPWLKMSEEEQTKFRADIIDRASDAVKQAVRCIATGDRVNFRATCEQVQFKADGVKAALTLYNSPQAHALADVAGGTVLIVIEDGSRYLGTGGAIKPQPDNGQLFSDAEPVKTAKLGELPNDAGVYICDPDESDKWEQKKHRLADRA